MKPLMQENMWKRHVADVEDAIIKARAFNDLPTLKELLRLRFDMYTTDYDVPVHERKSA